LAEATPTAPATESPAHYRPLGLSLAILATLIGFGLMPLAPLLLLAWTAITRRQIGLDILGNNPITFVTMGLGGVIIIACFFAWRGRPYGVRRVLLLCVWLMTALQAYQILFPRGSEGLFGVGGNISGGAFTLLCLVPVLTLVPLYVTWYLNRYPARQFYNFYRRQKT
jgi:hypothetical protein